MAANSSGYLDTINHERIIQTKEYISLENKCNAAEKSNKIMKIMIIFLLSATLFSSYLLYQSSQKLRSTSQLLDDAYSLNLDAQTNYYSGYLDGRSDYAHEHEIEITEAKESAYVDGYSSAMIEMAGETDFASAYVDGFEDGWSVGHDKGYTSGYDDGFEVANDPGYDGGYEDGYEDGYYDGYNDGLKE